MTKNGRVELIIGPMFSGKTSELVRRIGRYKFGKNKKETVILKWDRDLRYDETETNGKTHDGNGYLCLRVGKELTPIIKYLLKYDVIGVDEGHFFDIKDELANFCDVLANKYHKVVIVAALDSDFMREAFFEVVKLVPKCEKVDKLQSICTNCSNDASFSLKIGDKSKRIDVGGKEKYIPVCRECYMEKSK